MKVVGGPEAGLDCCAAPAKLAPELRLLKRDTGCTYASIYRGNSAAVVLHRCGKHTQAEIFATYPPGTANPPGRSTHECRNDGVAYPGPAYIPLPWWCCGIDVDDAHVRAICDAARKRNWIITITYPGSPVEYHHVNLRRKPRIRNPLKPLRYGMKGVRVRRLAHNLHYIHRPQWAKGGYLGHGTNYFGDHVREAVKDFQRDHHLPADGIVGIHTRKQLAVSKRHERRRRREHR